MASQKQPLKLEDLDRVTLKSRGEGDIATLCSGVHIESDRMSSDPAALSDWQECVAAVLAEDTEADH
jgi:hypothetical protein